MATSQDKQNEALGPFYQQLSLQKFVKLSFEQIWFQS